MEIMLKRIALVDVTSASFHNHTVLIEAPLS